MLKDENIVFGDKNKFAIEVKPYKIPKKFFLRLWFENNSIGDFKKGGSSDPIINDYFKLKKNFDQLYVTEFSVMTDLEIFEEICYDLNIERTAEEENKLFERLQMFAIDLGDCQFNDYTFIIINYCQKKEVKFLIYKMDGESTPKLYSHNIYSDYFFSVYKELMRYAADNNLKKHLPFFPENFSYQDIS